MKNAWSNDEVIFLEANYKNMHYLEIGKVLGRSCKSVSRKAENLGLVKKTNKSWGKDDVDYLISNYNAISPVDISMFLNRT